MPGLAEERREGAEPQRHPGDGAVDLGDRRRTPTGSGPKRCSRIAPGRTSTWSAIRSNSASPRIMSRMSSRSSGRRRGWWASRSSSSSMLRSEQHPVRRVGSPAHRRGRGRIRRGHDDQGHRAVSGGRGQHVRHRLLQDEAPRDRQAGARSRSSSTCEKGMRRPAVHGHRPPRTTTRWRRCRPGWAAPTPARRWPTSPTSRTSQPQIQISEVVE